MNKTTLFKAVGRFLHSLASFIQALTVLLLMALAIPAILVGIFYGLHWLFVSGDEKTVFILMIFIAYWGYFIFNSDTQLFHVSIGNTTHYISDEIGGTMLYTAFIVVAYRSAFWVLTADIMLVYQITALAFILFVISTALKFISKNIIENNSKEESH